MSAIHIMGIGDSKGSVPNTAPSPPPPLKTSKERSLKEKRKNSESKTSPNKRSDPSVKKQERTQVSPKSTENKPSTSRENQQEKSSPSMEKQREVNGKKLKSSHSREKQREVNGKTLKSSHSREKQREVNGKTLKSSHSREKQRERSATKIKPVRSEESASSDSSTKPNAKSSKKKSPANTAVKNRDGSKTEYVDPIIVLNDVPFFIEEKCKGEDDFSFPCCLMPNSPRYPPNPRPKRRWDPSYLPASTAIPSAIGRNCRRCGKPVYLAELYLSSRGCYHSECYKCCLCGKTLDSWTVAEFKGEIFCKGCYRRNFGTHGVGFGVGAGALQTP